MNTALGLLLLAATTLNTTQSGTLKPASRFLENTTENVVLSVPYVHQVNDLPEDKKAEIGSTACGPASLAMVFKYMHLDAQLYEVIEKLPSSVYLRGARFYRLNEGPKIYDLTGVSFKNSPKEIFAKLNEQKPVIINVQNYDGITGHALVVVGMKGFDGENAKSLIVHDPWVGPYREFEYVNANTLKQPEGYWLSIGTLDPFVIE